MRIERIMAELVGNVWAMEPGKLGAIAGVLARKNAGDGVAVDRETAEELAQRASIELSAVQSSYLAAGGVGSVTRTEYGLKAGSVAVINVGGVIAPRASMVNGSSLPRGTSLESLRAARAQAERDPEVGSILYRVNSPGGYAEGMAEFSDDLFAMNPDAANPAAGGKGKPTWAYVEGMGASAAYWLSSQTSRVESAKDAMVGSIGTYMVVYDQSAAAEKEGVAVHLIRSPETDQSVKGVGTPGTKVTDAARANWQRGTDAFQKFFSAGVGRGRRMGAKQVAALATGETWMGETARAKGLVDAVRPIGETLAEMGRKFPAASRGGDSFGGVAAADGSVRMTIDALGELMRRAAESQAGRAVAAAGQPDGMEMARAVGGRVEAGVVVHIEDVSRGAETPEHAAGSAVAPATDSLVTAQPAEAGRKDDMRHRMVSVLLAAGAAGTGQEQGGNGGGATGTIDPKALEAAREEGRKAEAARQASLRAIAAPFLSTAGVGDALAAALADGSATEDRFRQVVMDKVAEAQKPTGIVAETKLEVGTTGRQRWSDAVETALFVRSNPGVVAKIGMGGAEADRIARAIGYAGASDFSAKVQAAESGRVAHRRLSSLAEDCLRMKGIDPSSMGEDAIFAATFGQSTSDFANLLANVANKSLQAAFAETPTTWRKFCAVGSASDFKSQTRVGLSEGPNLKQVPEGGKLDAAKLIDRKFTAATDSYGRTFGLSRQAYRNDNLGGFARIPAIMGAAAARLPEDLAIAKLVANPTLPDGVVLFHATHRNKPSDAALSMANLDIAIQTMRGQKGFGEDTPFLDVMPKFILTGLTLAATAKTLFQSITDPTSGQANANRPNIVAGVAEPISTPRIVSTTAWYLFADPAMYPVIELTFLDGRQVPIIVPKPQLSIAEGPQWEVMFDVAANVVGFEGGLYNAGA